MFKLNKRNEIYDLILLLRKIRIDMNNITTGICCRTDNSNTDKTNAIYVIRTSYLCERYSEEILA